MKLHKLKNTHKLKKKSRVGRGIAAGGGKTAGRGTKGQKARTGFNIPLRFEGGQSSFIQRIPKKTGFSGKPKNILVVKTSKIAEKFKLGEKVSPESLIAKKIVKNLPKNYKIKILFDKPIKDKLKLKNCLVSKKAQKFFE